MLVRYLLIASVLHVTFGFIFSSTPTSETRDTKSIETTVQNTSLIGLLNIAFSSWIFKFMYCIFFGNHNIRECANEATNELYAYPQPRSGLFNTFKNRFFGDKDIRQSSIYPQHSGQQYYQYQQYPTNKLYQTFPYDQNWAPTGNQLNNYGYEQNAAQLETKPQYGYEGMNYGF